MATLNVLTDEGFDFYRIYNRFDGGDIELNFRSLLENRAVVLGAGLKFQFKGDFVPNSVTGTIKSLTILEDNKPVVEMLDLNLPLSSFVTGPTFFGALFFLSIFGAVNEVHGGDGRDVFLCPKGTYFGGGGDDRFVDFNTDRSRSIYNGEAGLKDTVDYSTVDNDTKTGVTASLADKKQNTGEAANDTYRSIEGLVGTKYADTLIGNTKNNFLSGGRGDDTLIGGRGKDELDGGAGDDFVSYAGASSVGGDFKTGVTASLALGRGQTGDAKGDKYIDVEGLIGSDFNDKLTGEGRDVIFGGAGDDTLAGTDQDKLWGDSTAFGVNDDDVFLMRSPSHGFVNIMDFDVFDRIAISRKGFGLAQDFAFQDGVSFITGSAPRSAGTGPTLLYNQDNHFLSFDADGRGSAGPTLLARVSFHSQQFIDIADIIIV